MRQSLILLLFAAIAATASAADDPKEKLSRFVGDWTLEGREATFRETCEWFHNRSHVVCNSESKRAAGVGRGVSVFSYSESKKRLVYYHYGSSGVVAEMDVFFVGDVFHATGERRDGADVIREQVRITWLPDGTFDFQEEASTNGGAWKPTVRVHYIPRPPTAN
jgi:hypothetical protein